MKHVFTSSDLGEAVMVKSVLEAEGIQVMLKNEVLSGGLSFSLGYTNTWPEVWVLQDDQLEKAQEIVADWTQQDEKLSDTHE
jgi:hypothetical protein